MFAATIKSVNPFSLSKRAILIGLTIVVLAVAVFAVTPSISFAGDASAPSACGLCATR
jgi:hypothetical protein